MTQRIHLFRGTFFNTVTMLRAAEGQKLTPVDEARLRQSKNMLLAMADQVGLYELTVFVLSHLAYYTIAAIDNENWKTIKEQYDKLGYNTKLILNEEYRFLQWKDDTDGSKNIL